MNIGGKYLNTKQIHFIEHNYSLNKEGDYYYLDFAITFNFEVNNKLHKSCFVIKVPNNDIFDVPSLIKEILQHLLSNYVDILNSGLSTPKLLQKLLDKSELISYAELLRQQRFR